MKVEVDVLGSQSPVSTVSVDEKQHLKKKKKKKTTIQSSGAVKADVAVLGSPSLIVCIV